MCGRISTLTLWLVSFGVFTETMFSFWLSVITDDSCPSAGQRLSAPLWEPLLLLSPGSISSIIKSSWLVSIPDSHTSVLSLDPCPDFSFSSTRLVSLFSLLVALFLSLSAPVSLEGAPVLSGETGGVLGGAPTGLSHSMSSWTSSAAALWLFWSCGDCLASLGWAPVMTGIWTLVVGSWDSGGSFSIR